MLYILHPHAVAEAAGTEHLLDISFRHNNKVTWHKHIRQAAEESPKRLIGGDCHPTVTPDGAAVATLSYGGFPPPTPPPIGICVSPMATGTIEDHIPQAPDGA
ncbi:MAG: hypothetical protein LUI04_07275 [Porphyromonadaceae bacterium]|nr:hypothetical protein [Porphyromonadaceae bacterium]